MKCEPQSIAQTIYDRAFGPSTCRDPRSEEYKAGVRDWLLRRASGVPRTNPYALGTAQADAWFAGTQEGAMRWREYQEEQE